MLLESISLTLNERTGERVYQCRVVDLAPEWKGHPRETVVEIVADQMPVLTTLVPFPRVEFEDLTAIPTAVGPGQVVFSALRASGVTLAALPEPGCAATTSPHPISARMQSRGSTAQVRSISRRDRRERREDTRALPGCEACEPL